MMVQAIGEFKPSHATLQQPATTSFCPHDRSDSYAKNIKTVNPSSASIMYNRTVLPAPFADSRIPSSP